MEDDEFEQLMFESCGCGGAGLMGEENGIDVFMQNIAKIHEYSGEILASLRDGDGEMEDWIEDKISKASAALSDVKHYMQFKKSAYSLEMHAQTFHPAQWGPGNDYSQMAQHGSVSGEKLAPMTQFPSMTAQANYSLGSDNQDFEQDDMGDEMGTDDMDGIEVSDDSMLPADEDLDVETDVEAWPEDESVIGIMMK